MSIILYYLDCGIENEKIKLKKAFLKYKQKIYVFENCLEIYNYEIPTIKGFHTKGQSKFSDEEDIKLDIRKKVITRT